MSNHFLVAAALSVISASCSFVEKARVAQPGVLANAKSVYVVRENPSNEVGVHLEAAFADHGLKVTSGPLASKRKDADLYVEYVDRWQWDVTMYLKSLDVTVHDNRNGELVASGNFHQGFPHSFPNANEKSKAIVNSMFEKDP